MRKFIRVIIMVNSSVRKKNMLYYVNKYEISYTILS